MKKQYKFLTAGTLMALLVTGFAPYAYAQDLDGTESGKQAQVSDGMNYGHVYGVSDGTPDPDTWKFEDAAAEGGIIKMNGGQAFNMYGGTAYTFASRKANTAANGNTVDISGGKVDIAVYGGMANGYNTEASGNIINISGGEIGINDTIKYAVVGGWANSLGKDGNAHAKANNNAVLITGGVLKSGIYGSFVQGYDTEQFESNNNTVNISGNAKVSGDVYGGYIFAKNYASGLEVKTGSANNNKVIISGSADIAGARLHGSNINGTGNELIINGWHGAVSSIDGFNAIRFNDVKWQNNGTVVNINDGSAADLHGTEIDAGHINFTDSKAINANGRMVLIHSENDEHELDDAKVQSGGFTAGVAVQGSGEAVLQNGDLVYKITDIKTARQTNLVAENRAVAAAFINQGTDLISDSLDTLSRGDNYGIKTFAAVHGNSSKYDVNSDLKINGWSTIAGVGNSDKFTDGDEFSWGVFYENGSGNYRTYNDFNNEFFRGDGSLVYNGGGIAARYENANGVYTEGSLRAGTLKSEMDNALRDGAGNYYGYESDSAYYGAHIGVGKIISLNDNSDLDVYGKFFHTYTEGDSFSVANDEFEFDSITSDRLRIGARVNTNKENAFSIYYGLAYEYEFNGDADMRTQNLSAPQQSLQGSSYIAELGFNYQPTPESPWSFDLNMRGYAGEREGGSFSVQATYTF